MVIYLSHWVGSIISLRCKCINCDVSFMDFFSWLSFSVIVAFHFRCLRRSALFFRCLRRTVLSFRCLWRLLLLWMTVFVCFLFFFVVAHYRSFSPHPLGVSVLAILFWFIFSHKINQMFSVVFCSYNMENSAVRFIYLRLKKIFRQLRVYWGIQFNRCTPF